MRLWSSRKRRLAELPQDIQDHIEMETSDNVGRGMSPDEARSAALRKFGNITLVIEDTRAVWHPVWADRLVQDVRYALRTFARQPGFAAVIVLTLALAIGLNTAVFSVLNTALFQPLPYPEAERLMWLGNYNLLAKQDNWVSRTDYLIWREARSFERMAAYGNHDLALSAGDEASQERVVSISGDFWNLTGARPAFGRLFDPGQSNAIVLSWALFERRFAGDARIVGKSVTLNGWAFTVTGVLPRDFRFLFPQQYASGDEIRDIDAFIPIPDALMRMPPAGVQQWDAATRRLGPAPFWIVVVGRLKSAVAPGTARAELETIYSRIAKEDPGPFRESRVLRLVSLKEKLSGGIRRPLITLMVGVGFVLLIACANIANLLLVRASARQREMAIRVAVGAGRTRVVRQVLTESAVLGLLGCATGLLVGKLAISFVIRLAPQAVPRMAETSVDGRVLLYALVLSLSAGLIFGLAPAFAAWTAEVSGLLKSETGTRSSGRARLRPLLAASQLALAIILLAGAGLMVKSFWRMHRKPPGFEPSKILVLRITPSGPTYQTWPAKQNYIEQLQQSLVSLPGVAAVGIDSGAMNTTVHLDGVPRSGPADGLFAAIRGVSPGYLQAMGIPLLEGSGPPQGSLFGAVVNQAFARQVAGGAVGRQLSGSILNDTITGVVADFKTRQLDAEPFPEIYIAFERLPLQRSMRVVVRCEGAPAGTASLVRDRIAGVDRTQPVFEFQTLEEALSGSIAPRRFILFLLGIFAASALALAMIGIYGVIAYSVSLRTREIGIRLALGASRRGVVSMMLRQGMSLAAAGICAGVILALGLTRLMASLLYDVQPNDAWVFAAVSVTLGASAALAATGPALRAARVDPIRALRYE